MHMQHHYFIALFVLCGTVVPIVQIVLRLSQIQKGGREEAFFFSSVGLPASLLAYE